MNTNSSAFDRGSVSILSPLRYPGAKRRLSGYIGRALELNGLRPELYVEPFAGGASVALQLLAEDRVKKIGLVDLDPLVSAFWTTTFYDADWLCRQVQTIDVNLATWRRLKTADSSNVRQRALACLFLNRTSFSGILAPTAGPLGGWKQTSKYGLECRFPRETLVKRIRQAAALGDRVAFVWNVSWARAMSTLEAQGRLASSETFLYLDPPFFAKADRLYRHFFKPRDHKRLRDRILTVEAPWLLSYDSVAGVDALYGETALAPTQLELLYSTARNGGITVAREVILTNLAQLPPENRLWRRAEEWRQAKSRNLRPGSLGVKRPKTTLSKDRHIGEVA